MRTLAMVVLLVPLAGCVGDDMATPPGPVTTIVDACMIGICPVEGELHPEALLPEGAETTLTWDIASWPVVDGFWARDGQWGWMAQDAAGTSFLHAYENGHLRSAQAPEGSQIQTGRAVWQDGPRVWAVTSNGPAALISWDLRNDHVATLDLAGVPADVEILGADGTYVLLQSPGSLPRGETALWLWGPEGLHSWSSLDGRPFTAALLDGAVFRADLVEDGARLVLPTFDGGAFPLWQGDETLVGVWAHGGRVAFSTLAAGKSVWETELWEVDRRNHSLSPIGFGWAPRFFDERMFYHFQGEGLGEEVRVTDGVGDRAVFFLPDDRERAWDSDGQTVWWLDTPSSDPRFDEAPNPTDFSTVLYTTG